MTQPGIEPRSPEPLVNKIDNLQFYDIKYSCLIRIFSIPIYNFKHSHLIVVFYPWLHGSKWLFDNIHLSAVRWFQVISFKFCHVSWGYRTHWLYLGRGLRPLPNDATCWPWVVTFDSSCWLSSLWPGNRSDLVNCSNLLWLIQVGWSKRPDLIDQLVMSNTGTYMFVLTIFFKLLWYQTSTLPFILKVQEGDGWGSIALRYQYLKTFKLWAN